VVDDDRILRREEVEEFVGLSSPTIYHMMRRNECPPCRSGSGARPFAGGSPNWSSFSIAAQGSRARPPDPGIRALRAYCIVVGGATVGLPGNGS